MDIRGVEITNQLRSAIRAKLIELGVRYDEELPDYILVMVVNKKSRQQMNEDLNLFLEDSTEPFVDWLHDQVLKKLQKVTVAKKKSTKEIASVNIKKEEENEVKLENEKTDVTNKPGPVTKKDRDREFEELVGDLALLNEEDHSVESDISKDKSNKKSSSINLNDSEKTRTYSQKPELIASEEIPVKSFNLDNTSTSSRELEKSNVSLEKTNEDLPHKRTSDVLENDSHEDNLQSSKRKRFSNHSDSEDDRGKSSVNKPKITSIVSVKSRLGVLTSPSKKQDLHSKIGTGSRNSPNRHIESRRNENSTTHYSSNRSRSSDRRKSNEDSRNERHRSDNLRKDKFSRSTSLQDKGRLSDKSGTIKSRLGNSNTHKQDRLSLKSSNSSKISKPRISSIRSRLGVRNKSLGSESFDVVSDSIRTTHNDQNYQEEDDAESIVNTSLKSQIIAVPKPKSQDSKQRHSSKKSITSKKEESESRNEGKDDDDDDDDDDGDQCKVPSKVIVTPRPLQPLQALQKRATKSLLLKAVAEANKSVVMQKKVDPCLKEQKPTSKITVKRDLREGKILSVHLNSKKRMVMEKIQVELDNKHLKKFGKSCTSKMVTDEDFNVVKSLFNRSNDRQKFLVTLNGYNNNIFDNQYSDDEKQINEEMNEDDELPTMNDPYESYNEDDHIINDEAFEQDEDQYYDYYENEGNPRNEFINQSIEMQENNSYQKFKSEENSSQKKRKLSPIVYNISRSNSPNDKSLMSSLLESVLHTDKRPIISSVITTLPDKSGEKCRYWPNCTLGIKCAYYHPEVSCSSFPACKFGDKCAYKHPKCKFGSACTKLNCIFSHPPIQCKYHPYCMKPGCPFSHPKTSTSSISSILSPLTPLTPDLSSARAKFTWKKKD